MPPNDFAFRLRGRGQTSHPLFIIISILQSCRSRAPWRCVNSRGIVVRSLTSALPAILISAQFQSCLPRIRSLEIVCLCIRCLCLYSQRLRHTPHLYQDQNRTFQYFTLGSTPEPRLSRPATETSTSLNARETSSRFREAACPPVQCLED